MTIRVGLPTVMALLLSTASAPAETRGTVASRRARPGDGKLNSTAGAFRKLLDATEKLVSIASIPWYVREVFLP